MTINLSNMKKRYDGNLEVVVEMPNGYCESIHKTSVDNVVLIKGGEIHSQKLAFVIETESGGIDVYGQVGKEMYPAQANGV